MSVTTSRDRLSDVRGMLGFALWGAVYITARLLLEVETLGWGTRATIALVPVPLFAWVLWSVSQGITQMDELERRIQLEALAFAFPLTLLMLMTLGLLELAVGLNPNDWSYRHVWPFVFLFYFVGVFLARRRYA